LQTFLDDPLRILRTIRFASRFDFKLDPSILVAAKNENIRACLLEKVSFERLGTELDKMFEGNRPMQSVLYLKDFEIL
jgi:tRNA nucleotidyltransferase (CCA-adding enzyme)